jgi:transcription initiation factor TFIIF subunit beta
MERWSAIDVEDVHLASLRVYHNAAGPSGKKPRIVLFLPPKTGSDQTQDPRRPAFAPNPYTPQGTGDEPDAYELEMINDSVDNQIVVAERPKDLSLSISNPTTPSGFLAPVNPRARTTILTGRIKHDCNLRPVFSESYRRQMKERSRKYNTPKRQIQIIEDADVPGGRGGINRLTSGMGVGAGNAFSNLIVRALTYMLFSVVRCANFTDTMHACLFVAIETKTCQRHIRAYGAYTSKPTA